MSTRSNAPVLTARTGRAGGWRIVTAAALSLGAAAFGAVVGLVVGANIGGNWMPSVSFAGQRGYEATGLIGAVVGGVVLGTMTLWLVARRDSR